MESHDIIVQYFGGTLLTFYTESRQDDITSKNRTRFEWADEVGVVTKFSKRLFVPREFDMSPRNYKFFPRSCLANNFLCQDSWKNNSTQLYEDFVALL